MKYFLLAGLLCGCLYSNADAGIIVNRWDLQTLVANPINRATQNTVSLPFHTSDIVSVPGLATSTTTYDFEVMGESASFQFGFDQQIFSDHTPVLLQTEGNSPYLEFSITGSQQLRYSLDGFFTGTGEADVFIMTVILVDLTNRIPGEFGTRPTTLFYNDQDSRNATDESFVLGGTGGNNTHALDGTATGLLTPGVTYGLSYDFVMQDRDSSPVSALGELNLNISPIPEPSSIVLLSMGVISLCGYGWRRKRHQAA